MEFVKIFLSDEIYFKVPINHQRLKRMIAMKFQLSEKYIESSVSDVYPVIYVEPTKFISVKSRHKGNIFLINFYLGLVKRNQKLEVKSLESLEDEIIIKKINEFLSLNLNFDEVVILMNNFQLIDRIKRVSGYNNRIIKQLSDEYSVSRLRDSQREIDKSYRKK